MQEQWCWITPIFYPCPFQSCPFAHYICSIRYWYDSSLLSNQMPWCQMVIQHNGEKWRADCKGCNLVLVWLRAKCSVRLFPAPLRVMERIQTSLDISDSNTGESSTKILQNLSFNHINAELITKWSEKVLKSGLRFFIDCHLSSSGKGVRVAGEYLSLNHELKVTVNKWFVSLFYYSYIIHIF